MALFSGFITNYMGGSLNSPNNTDASLNDIISNVILVPTQNSLVGHNGNDGFIFFAGLLIQFSTDTVFTESSQFLGTNTFVYPIKYQTNDSVYNVMVSNVRCKSGNNPVAGIYPSPTASSFGIRIRSDSGNITWVSIGSVPTVPMYTQITGNTITWKSVACSADGKYVVGGGISTTIRVSNAYGYGSGTVYGSWASITSPNTSSTWNSFSVSNTGQFMAGISISNGYWYSTTYGVSWTNQTTPSVLYNWITINSDGSQLVAVANDGIYRGNLLSFSALAFLTNQVTNGTCIASDYTGKYLVAGSITNLYTSTDNGSNWISRITGSWKQVVSNSTGQYLVAIKNTSDNIYISNNYGVSWSTVATLQSWISIAIDSSGKYIKAVYSSAFPFYSNNYGINWIQLSSSSNITNAAWSAVCSNSTGAFSVLCTSSSNNPYVSFNASS